MARLPSAVYASDRDRTWVRCGVMGDELSWLGALCADVGLLLPQLSPEVRQRLSLLAAHTETVTDGRRIATLARAIFDHYAAHKPERQFSALEQRIVIIGSLFADIGKTGPLNAEAPEQALIVEMFSVEGVRDDQQSVSQFFATYFPADAEERERRFTSLGLDPRMPMRAFWNLHAAWTLEIAQHSGLPEETIAAAASHHLLEDINPRQIVSDDGSFAMDFGDNLGFDRAEKLVILLDKYDALVRRGRRSHREAISWLRNLLSQHHQFRDDAEFDTLLSDLDVVAESLD